MPSFQQCKDCGTFLLSTSPLAVTDHHIGQCRSSAKKILELDSKNFKTEISDDDKFRTIKFPLLRIILSRCLPLLRPNMSVSENNGRQSKSQILKRKRNRYTTEIAKTKTMSKKKKTGDQSEDKEEVTEGEPLLRAYRFDCDQCPGKFYSKVEYNRHMNVHNGSRRLITCIVCLRMFNKRDSLNQHYAAHENAEEREVKLDLFNFWPINKGSDNKYSRIRQGCKFCLLMHTNQASFINHIRSEHGDAPSHYPCRLDNCIDKFLTIKDLLHHAKEQHPMSFYGRYTHNKIKGLTVVQTSFKQKGDLSANALTNNVNKGKLSRSKSGAVKKKKSRKRKNFFNEASDSEDEEFKFVEAGSPTRQPNGVERAVELERVHIVDNASGNNSRVAVQVKRENSKFYSSYQEQQDPFFMYELTSQLQDNSASVPNTSTNEFKFNPSSGTDSVPVVLSIKREII